MRYTILIVGALMLGYIIGKTMGPIIGALATLALIFAAGVGWSFLVNYLMKR